jgi:hypothetical protein
MRLLKILIDPYLEICDLFPSRLNSLWELILHLETSSFNFWNSSTRRILYPENFSQIGFQLERFHWKQGLPFSKISFKTIHFKPHTSADVSHLFIICPKIFCFVQTVSILQRWQTAVTLFRRLKIQIRLQKFRLPSAQTSQLYMKLKAIFMWIPFH